MGPPRNLLKCSRGVSRHAPSACCRAGPGDDEWVVKRFNEGSNERNLDALARLMTDDHAFIDSVGVSVDGKQPCLAAWRGFFDAYPDYRNEFESLVSGGRRSGRGEGAFRLLRAGPGRPGAVDSQGPPGAGVRVAGLRGHPADAGSDRALAAIRANLQMRKPERASFAQFRKYADLVG
jgi:hypothetical protein